jgi:hypothetical protein
MKILGKNGKSVRIEKMARPRGGVAIQTGIRAGARKKLPG